MEKLKSFLINLSEEHNPWILSEEKIQELIFLVETALFPVPPEIKGIIINSAKTISFMVKEKKYDKNFILIEFTNYFLGSLYKNNPVLYLILKEQISEKIDEKISYNLRSTDHKLGMKYFPDHQLEYDFILKTKLISDKVS